MVWLHCVWSIHKTWCYKVVLFDYQGFAPQQAFSLVDHVTTAFAYLEKKAHANEYSTEYQVCQVSYNINHYITAQHCHAFNPEKASPMKQATIKGTGQKQCSM